MNKFLINLMIFGCIITMCDVLCGFGFRYLVDHAKGGDTRLSNYICHKSKDEVLIFGSSRALHHYDPLIIEDSLHLSSFNCAKDGNGIIMMYGRIKILMERYQPKVILYDVCTDFDLLENDNRTYLPGLRYDYDNKYIDSIFWKVDPTERFKMMAYIYRYNSRFLQIIMDNISPLQRDQKGYRPEDKVMEYEFQDNISTSTVYHYDSLKLYYLERLIQDCKGRTMLIFTASPSYKNTEDKVYSPLKELCESYNVPFINHFCDDRFNFRKDYFYDTVHLNRKGATVYTKTIIDELKTIINKKNIFSIL